MIRKQISNQGSISAISKTANYILAVNGFAAMDTNLLVKWDDNESNLIESFSNGVLENMNKNKNKRGRQQTVATYHDMVSFHTDDVIDKDKAIEIVKELYEKTHNLSNRDYVLAYHDNTDEPHVHIIWAVRDNDGKAYNQSNDYLIIERELDKLEDKYSLISPENRKSRIYDGLEIDYADEPESSEKSKKIAREANIKFREIIEDKRTVSNNERMLDAKGIKSNKQEMKDITKDLLKKASSPSAFVYLLHQNGFEILPNSNNSYSVSKDGQTFKASELNISYKNLVKKFNEDEQFSSALLECSKTPAQQQLCSITVDTKQEPEFMSKIHRNSTLATKFRFQELDDKVEYFYKNSNNKKSFEYHKDPGRTTFHDTSSQTIKAGIQRLTADTPPPSTFTVTGTEEGKRRIWLEFQLMNLEQKGYQLEGYKPKPEDLALLEKSKSRLDNMNKLTPEKAPEAPQLPINAEPVPTAPEQEKTPYRHDYGDDFMYVENGPHQPNEGTSDTNSKIDYGDDFIYVEDNGELIVEEVIQPDNQDNNVEQDEIDDLERMGISLDDESREKFEAINEPEPDKPRRRNNYGYS